jgi:hypothetical protein
VKSKKQRRGFPSYKEATRLIEQGSDLIKRLAEMVAGAIWVYAKIKHLLDFLL